MDDHDDLLASEMAEHSTPPPTASNIANDLQPCTQRCRKNRSRVWDHFTPDPELEYKRATCNHCQSSIKCDNGTSSLLAHSKRCYDRGWNSTYLMLEATLKHQEAFLELEF
uniref:BED-type domain-containing protein n=1 Tax=Glycine max TaxID=3847 RepID=K7MXR9_SOYBN